MGTSRLSRIVALSGPAYSGKTTLADALRTDLCAGVVRVRELIADAAKGSDRPALQLAGMELEEGTTGGWIAAAIPLFSHETIVVDSVRTPDQIRALEEITSTVVVYLAAAATTCEKRFRHTRDPADRSIAFSALVEGEPPGLVEIRATADIVVATDEMDIGEVRRSAVASLSGAAHRPPRSQT
jgi:tRNA uridine 5-carbamoylmethylation protein Kti12